MGAGLEAEIHAVICDGVRPAFPRLVELRSLNFYRENAKDDSSASGTKVIRLLLESAVAEFDPGPRTEAVRALLALDREGKRNRPLTGDDGLRQKAAEHFGIGWDQFHRTKEDSLIADFAAWIVVWDRTQGGGQRAVVRMDWEHVHAVADKMYRVLEQTVRPDVVVTMSGPGSFAAIYTMKLNPRDVPVLVAVTFPSRDQSLAAEHQFRGVAMRSGWSGIRTSKWSVFVPDILFKYPPGSRVVILDDRVISGETQVLLRRLLTEVGLDVWCAALFAPQQTAIEDLIVGARIDGEFEMPWGPSRGRT